MDRWNEHTMEMELESMDRQGEAMEIRLSSLGLAGAMLGEQEIERLRAEVARLQVEITEERAQVAAWMGVTKGAQADVARLTANTIELYWESKEEIARLREALEGILQAEDEAGCSFDEQGTDWPDIEVARAAIGEAAVE